MTSTTNTRAVTDETGEGFVTFGMSVRGFSARQFTAAVNEATATVGDAQWDARRKS